MAEIGNRKERLRDYASFPGFLPLNPLRTPSPPLKRAGTPCTRERGLRLGLTALRGASEGWVTGYGGLKQLLRNQVSLRSLILVFLSLRDLGDEGVTMGLPPQALPEGDSPSDSHLRFAAVLSFFQVFKRQGV